MMENGEEKQVTRAERVEELLNQMQYVALALEHVAHGLAALYPGDAEAADHAHQADGAARVLDQWCDFVERREGMR